MTKISGVYKITNKITGDFYIGSSKNIKERWSSHKNPSDQAQHPNSRMYQDMAQYGLNNFTFEIIEETTNLREREQYWIDRLNPTYNRNRANGWDFERIKKRLKRYYDTHREEIIAQRKEYHQTENYKESARKSSKRYNNQLCLYNGETITLNALRARFYYQGIPHPVLEAKKYLISN